MPNSWGFFMLVRQTITVYLRVYFNMYQGNKELVCSGFVCSAVCSAFVGHVICKALLQSQNTLILYPVRRKINATIASFL